MVELFIAAAQALSLAALIYGAYFVLLRAPQLARTPAESVQFARKAVQGSIEGGRERGRD